MNVEISTRLQDLWITLEGRYKTYQKDPASEKELDGNSIACLIESLALGATNSSSRIPNAYPELRQLSVLTLLRYLGELGDKYRRRTRIAIADFKSLTDRAKLFEARSDAYDEHWSANEDAQIVGLVNMARRVLRSDNIKIWIVQ
jgi:hypothetical protein